MKNLMKKSKKGFTLMEMLIVVAIIAILVVIAIPTFTNALNEARISSDTANARAFYAEGVIDGMLNDGTVTLDQDDAPACQAGSITVSGSTLDTFTVVYIPTNGTAVTFPQG